MQGLAAVAEQKKKQEEAQKAASMPVEGLKAAAPKPAEKPAGKPIEKPKPVEQMPKDELDALRIAEQKKFEAKRKAAEEAAAKKKK